MISPMGVAWVKVALRATAQTRMKVANFIVGGRFVWSKAAGKEPFIIRGTAPGFLKTEVFISSVLSLRRRHMGSTATHQTSIRNDKLLRNGTHLIQKCTAPAYSK